jgi:branched-chain amino acid transport system substrate-binding protein
VVAVLGAMNSPCALALVPITKRYRTPQFTAGVGTSITKQGSDYVFRIAVGAISQTKELAGFAVEKLNQTKIAVLYSDDEYGASMANGFKDALAARGLQPAAFEASRAPTRTSPGSSPGSRRRVRPASTPSAPTPPRR